jgi:signal transduction histidine kinase
VSSTAFWVLCAVLPLVLLAIITERRYRYKMARLRIAKRREQQSRWRASKRDVLAEWKKRLRWLAGVQHDMRQPLHALGLLMAHPALAGKDENTKLVLQQITSCQAWLQDLAENIMEATRLELGEYREQKLSTISSMDVCHALAAWLGQLAQTKGLSFTLDVKDKPMLTDVRRLKRVLGNLVFNAVEHTYEGGVELQYRFDEDEAVHRFVIKDTGPGLAEHLLATDSTEPSSFGSDLPKTGIGLYVVKRLCHEMGWYLAVENQAHGGTHIVLELPEA